LPFLNGVTIAVYVPVNIFERATLLQAKRGVKELFDAALMCVATF
jgi:hypothetical protein